MAHKPHSTTQARSNKTEQSRLSKKGVPQHMKPCQTSMSYNRLLNETGRAGERMFSGVKLITH